MTGGDFDLLPDRLAVDWSVCLTLSGIDIRRFILFFSIVKFDKVLKSYLERRVVVPSSNSSAQFVADECRGCCAVTIETRSRFVGVMGGAEILFGQDDLRDVKVCVATMEVEK